MATVTEVTRKIELDDEDLDYMIDDIYPEVIIAGSAFYASDILKELDPICYEMIREELEKKETVYICNECGEEYDDEFEAESCCDIEEDEDE